MDVLNKQVDALKAAGEAQRAKNKAATDGLKALKEANLSDTEKFAKMSPFEQQRLKDVSQKVAAGGVGSLAKHDQEFLDSTGFASGAVSRFNIDRGNAAGAQGVFANLGTQNITPGEAARGMGPEGEAKASVLQFQQQAAGAGDRDIQRRLDAVMKEHKAETDKIVAGIKLLNDLGPIATAVEAALERRKVELEDFGRRLDLVGGTVQGMEKANVRGKMSNRPTG